MTFLRIQQFGVAHFYMEEVEDLVYADNYNKHLHWHWIDIMDGVDRTAHTRKIYDFDQNGFGCSQLFDYAI